MNIKVCLTNIRTVPSEHPLPIYSILIKSPPFLFKSCPISQLPHKGHQCSQSVNRSLILVHMFPHITRTAVPFMVRFLEEGQTTPLTLLVFPRYCCCSPSDLRFSIRGIIAVASAHYPLSAKWSPQLLVCVLTSHDSPHWYACRNGIWPLINLSALQISIVQLQWNWRFLFSYETILSSATLIDKKERECPNCNWTRTLFTFLVLLPKTFVVRVLTDQSRGTNDLILSRLV